MVVNAIVSMHKVNTILVISMSWLLNELGIVRMVRYLVDTSICDFRMQISPDWPSGWPWLLDSVG